MIGTEEFIKRLTGWCPYAKAPDTRNSVLPEYFSANTRAGGRDSGDPENPGWTRKLSSRILLVDSFLTLAYLLVMAQLGVNIAVFFAGFFISVTFFVSGWKKQMHRYDTLAQKPFLDYSGKKNLYRRLFRIITLIFYAALFCWIFAGGPQRDFLMKGTLSFFAGGLVSLWFCYLQILYWERKNHKTIYLNKSFGKWKSSYIIREER
ncbi:DUF1673 domain-containing protein [Methanosarcina sp. 2.H.A.1B.4]|uniref:DUF1673 domain-containing protein n=1 Tax=Methanosarcina sp. 2.H.A.1B.4 TaxID=1483600 RepID=UPI0006223956|nr:DUF1673 domain-containing protein [Methanosarcina sp. 2.H.A.1B.4]KKG07495.1 hypothetical protein EO92_07420 [Methanosarcina sp. 2.H.A.1B.4]